MYLFICEMLTRGQNAFSETRGNAFFMDQDADWYFENVLIRLRLTSKKRNCT